MPTPSAFSQLSKFSVTSDVVIASGGREPTRPSWERWGSYVLLVFVLGPLTLRASEGLAPFRSRNVLDAISARPTAASLIARRENPPRANPGSKPEDQGPGKRQADRSDVRQEIRPQKSPNRFRSLYKRTGVSHSLPQGVSHDPCLQVLSLRFRRLRGECSRFPSGALRAPPPSEISSDENQNSFAMNIRRNGRRRTMWLIEVANDLPGRPDPSSG